MITAAEILPKKQLKDIFLGARTNNVKRLLNKAQQVAKKSVKNFTKFLAKKTAAQKQAIRTQYKPPAPSKSRTKVPSAVSSGYGRPAPAKQNQYQK